jgi:hypothetical protein
MEVAAKQATPVPTRNSGLGMTMHGKVIVELRRLALGARPNITLVHQEKHKRWMIAGEEGGGCTGEVGHYIGFAGILPLGLAVSIPIQSLIPNSTQRRVISQEMIRAQLFRYGSSCDLLVTHHYLAAGAKEDSRPSLERRVLFQGKNGILAPGTKQPVFFDHAGEAVDFPKTSGSPHSSGQQRGDDSEEQASPLHSVTASRTSGDQKTQSESNSSDRRRTTD